MVRATATPVLAPRSTRRRREPHPESGSVHAGRAALPLVEAPERAVTGLRGFVLLTIMLLHAGVFGAGVLSVDLFLLLVAYSVTRALLRDHHDSGRFDLVRFYLGRLKPLIPVLALTIGLSLAAAIQFGTFEEIERFATQSIASMLLTNNWEEIAADVVYSPAFDRISPLGHLWVVAVIEQFFRVWPLAIFGVLALGRHLSSSSSRQTGRHPWQWSPITAVLVLVLSVTGAVVGAVLTRRVFAADGAERAYLGTDTHLVSLCGGAAAAAVSYLVVQRRSRRALTSPAPRSATVARLSRFARSALISTASAASIVWLGLLWTQATSYTQPWLYDYGLPLAAALGAILVLSLTSPVNQVRRFFNFSPFVGMGNVAYTVFIVHVPIFWFIQRLAPAGSSWDVLVLGMPAALIAGSAIHHLLAEPLRRRRWNPQGAVVIASLIAAVTAALWFVPSAKLAAPDGTGDIAVLALGDSRANNIAAALSFVDDEGGDVRPGAAGATTGGFSVVHAGVRGCGISGASAYRSPTGRESEAPGGCDAWQERWQEAIQTAHPDVILLDLSRDAMSRRVDGEWTDLTDPATASRYRESLRTVSTVTATARTRVLIANARVHTGDTSPEQAKAFNDLLEEFVAADPQFALLDLQDELCTDDSCTTRTQLGAGMYTDDRVHLSDAGKKQIASWLSAQVLSAYRGAANSDAAR